MKKTERNDLAAWREQCRRQLKRSLQQRLDYGFVSTYKPVLDDTPTRVFNTMEEYREWCERNLPRYLGYRRSVDKEFAKTLKTKK